MRSFRVVVAVVAATLSILTVSSARAAATEAPSFRVRHVGSEPLASTVSTVRDAGTLLVSWVLDHAPAEARGTEAQASTGSKTFDWSACPLISFDDVRQLLDPGWAEKLRSIDGWGHPLQFCLRRGDLGALQYVVGVRSSGRDGKFESSTYTAGPFAAQDEDKDIVWLDGIFIAWPEVPSGGQ